MLVLAHVAWNTQISLTILYYYENLDLPHSFKDGYKYVA